MRFLMINPPYVIGEDGMAVLPNKAMLPVGLLSLAAAFLNRAHNVEVFDCAPLIGMKWREELLAILEVEYDHILLCCHTARNITTCLEIANMIRGHYPHAHISIGGNVCTDLGTKAFRSLGLNIEAAIRGYGHALNVVEAMEQKTTGDIFPDTIPDVLPLPALELLDAQTHAWYREKSENRYPIIGPGGYGCLWKCNYCSAMMNCKHIPRQLINILNEVELAEQLGYKNFWCVDNLVDTYLNILTEFDHEMCRMRNCWAGMTRSEMVTRHSALWQRLNACNEIALGVESSSLEQLGSYNRGTAENCFHRTIDAFQILNSTNEINSTAFVMLDGPKETEQSFWQLYSFLKSIKPTSVSWSFYNPPATIGLVNVERSPNEYGFYRWPLGCSTVPRERVVQQAMILSGTWWCGWQLDEDNSFFEDEYEFGVRFKGHLLLQQRTARSPIGDLWEVWEEQNI